MTAFTSLALPPRCHEAESAPHPHQFVGVLIPFARLESILSKLSNKIHHRIFRVRLSNT